ncbi:MAG: hypothetical protein J7M40_12320 [Planctomycetes bacterium]|nr:hypothetical protein [Planctomycetota bacterium]
MSSDKRIGRIDMLVSVICVGFLAMVVGAIGASGQKKAKEIVCLSNLRQWGSYFGAYLSDNDGRFSEGLVHNWPTSEESADDGEWWVVLKPYYGDQDKLRYCPIATTHSSEGNLPWGAPTSAWGVFGDQGKEEWGTAGIPGNGYTGNGRWTAGVGGSYGINAWIYDQAPGVIGGNSAGYWRTVQLAGAQQIPMMGPSEWMGKNPSDTDDPPQYDGDWNGTYQQMRSFCVNRHGDYKSNLLFMDGSVRRIGIKNLWTLKWSRVFDTNNHWATATEAEWAAWGDGWLADLPE